LTSDFAIEAAGYRTPGSRFLQVGDLAPNLAAVDEARQGRRGVRAAGPRLALAVLAVLVTLRGVNALQANVDRARASADQHAIPVLCSALPRDDRAFKNLGPGRRYGKLSSDDGKNDCRYSPDQNGHGRSPFCLLSEGSNFAGQVCISRFMAKRSSRPEKLHRWRSG
jgi:hypothetical protein